MTAMGRIVKPVRMRPDHPFPEPLQSTSQAKAEKGKQGTKKKRRIKVPPVRARRRTIDPTMWGFIQLKGVFLENAAAPTSNGRSDTGLRQQKSEFASSVEDIEEKKSTSREDPSESESSTDSGDRVAEQEDDNRSLTALQLDVTTPAASLPSQTKALL